VIGKGSGGKKGEIDSFLLDGKEEDVPVILGGG
jgi:hypothetical protein